MSEHKRDTSHSATRRVAAIAAAAALAAGGLVLLAPALVPKEQVRTRVAEQLSAWTGREVSVAGEPIISLFPALTARIGRVAIAGPDAMDDAELVSMDGLSARIRLLPLLIGDIAFSSFELERPKIRLLRDEQGRRNWMLDGSAAAIQFAFTGDAPLGAVKIVDGLIEYRDRLAGEEETLAGVSLNARWPSIANPLSLEGSATWRGETLSLKAGVEKPAEFIGNRTTPFAFSLQSAPVEIDFSGEAVGLRRPSLQGELELSSPALRHFIGWIGKPLEEGLLSGPGAIGGHAVLDKTGIEVSEAKVDLDGNSAGGSLKIVFGDSPSVSGTLAFNRLDLDRHTMLFSSRRLNGEKAGQEIDSDWLNSLNADLRLSADELRAGGLRFDKSAASVLIEDGSMAIGIAQADLGDGRLTGQVSFSDLPAGASARARLRASNLPLAALGGGEAGQGLSGQVTFAADLSTRGASLNDWIAALSGRLAIEAQDGKLPGFSLETLAAAQREGVPASFGAAPQDPAMSYRLLQAALFFAEGTATVEKATLQAEALGAQLTGSIDLVRRELELAGEISPAGESAAQRIRLSGPIKRPRVSAVASP